MGELATKVNRKMTTTTSSFRNEVAKDHATVLARDGE